MPQVCAVGGCKSLTRDGFTLYTFPRDEKLNQRWREFVLLTRPDWKGPNRYSLICSAHFDATDYTLGSTNSLAKEFGYKPKLKPNACPSVLPLMTPSQQQQCPPISDGRHGRVLGVAKAGPGEREFMEREKGTHQRKKSNIKIKSSNHNDDNFKEHSDTSAMPAAEKKPASGVKWKKKNVSGFDDSLNISESEGLKQPAKTKNKRKSPVDFSEQKKKSSSSYGKKRKGDAEAAKTSERLKMSAEFSKEKTGGNIPDSDKLNVYPVLFRKAEINLGNLKDSVYMPGWHPGVLENGLFIDSGGGSMAVLNEGPFVFPGNPSQETQTDQRELGCAEQNTEERHVAQGNTHGNLKRCVGETGDNDEITIKTEIQDTEKPPQMYPAIVVKREAPCIEDSNLRLGHLKTEYIGESHVDSGESHLGSGEAPVDSCVVQPCSIKMEMPDELANPEDNSIFETSHARPLASCAMTKSSFNREKLDLSMAHGQGTLEDCTEIFNKTEPPCDGRTGEQSSSIIDLSRVKTEPIDTEESYVDLIETPKKDNGQRPQEGEDFCYAHSVTQTGRCEICDGGHHQGNKVVKEESEKVIPRHKETTEPQITGLFSVETWKKRKRFKRPRAHMPRPNAKFANKVPKLRCKDLSVKIVGSVTKVFVKDSSNRLVEIGNRVKSQSTKECQTEPLGADALGVSKTSKTEVFGSSGIHNSESEVGSSLDAEVVLGGCGKHMLNGENIQSRNISEEDKQTEDMIHNASSEEDVKNSRGKLMNGVDYVVSDLTMENLNGKKDEKIVVDTGDPVDASEINANVSIGINEKSGSKPITDGCEIQFQSDTHQTQISEKLGVSGCDPRSTEGTCVSLSNSTKSSLKNDVFTELASQKSSSNLVRSVIEDVCDNICSDTNTRPGSKIEENLTAPGNPPASDNSQTTGYPCDSTLLEPCHVTCTGYLDSNDKASANGSNLCGLSGDCSSGSKRLDSGAGSGKQRSDKRCDSKCGVFSEDETECSAEVDNQKEAESTVTLPSDKQPEKYSMCVTTSGEHSDNDKKHGNEETENNLIKKDTRVENSDPEKKTENAHDEKVIEDTDHENETEFTDHKKGIKNTDHEIDSTSAEPDKEAVNTEHKKEAENIDLEKETENTDTKRLKGIWECRLCGDFTALKEFRAERHMIQTHSSFCWKCPECGCLLKTKGAKHSPCGKVDTVFFNKDTGSAGEVALMESEHYIVTSFKKCFRMT